MFQNPAPALVLGRKPSEGDKVSVTIGHHQTKAAEVVEHMGKDILQSLAALAGAPVGVAELAFNALPEGTQDWLITYGLATDVAGELQITDLGREVIALTAERCPEPYADVAVGDLAESTRAGLEQLAARSGIRLKEPPAPAATTREDSAARRAGQRLALLVSEKVGGHRRAKFGAGEDKQARAAG
jgi:hypothetical protein